MKYRITNKNLASIIDELGEEYKDLLVEKLLFDSKCYDADTISLSELIQLDIQTKASLRNDKMRRRDKMLSLVSLVGILYILLGLLFFIINSLNNLSYRDNYITTIAVIISIMGMLVSFLSLVMKSVLKNSPSKKTNSTTLLYEIINKWKEIEALIYQLNPDNEKKSLRTMINNLLQNKIISQEDYDAILKLLKTRNKIVHATDELTLSQDELRELINNSNGVIKRLKKIIE